MKGQAFIGLPSEQSAEKALRETNGYILHDKPLVVVSFYCRSQEDMAAALCKIIIIYYLMIFWIAQKR